MRMNKSYINKTVHKISSICNSNKKVEFVL